MWQALVSFGRSLIHRALMVGLVILVGVSSFFLSLGQPDGLAATLENQPAPTEQTDRAYEFRIGAGIREEAYQQRVRDGEDPEKMPEPFERVPSFKDKREVPQTSGVEKTVSKTRELIEKVTNQ